MSPIAKLIRLPNGRYRLASPAEAHAEQVRRRNARINAKPRRAIPRKQRERIYARDGYACVYCGSGQDLTLDHLDPLAVLRRQGVDVRSLTPSDDDLVTACRSCNGRRGDGT